MKQKIERVRAHHGMCLGFYRGKGYSSDFTDNMWDALEYLQTQNPEVEIVDYDDHICASCPNLICGKATEGENPDRKAAVSEKPDRKAAGEKPEQKTGTEKSTEQNVMEEDNPRPNGSGQAGTGVCVSAEKVARYDSGVLKACGLPSGTRMRWLDYRAIVQEKIIAAGHRKEICGDCSWNALCK